MCVQFSCIFAPYITGYMINVIIRMQSNDMCSTCVMVGRKNMTCKSACLRLERLEFDSYCSMHIYTLMFMNSEVKYTRHQIDRNKNKIPSECLLTSMRVAGGGMIGDP